MKALKKLLMSGLVLSTVWASPVAFAQDDQTAEETSVTEQVPVNNENLELFNQILEANKSFNKIEGEIAVDLTMTDPVKNQEAPIKVSGTYQIQESPFAAYLELQAQDEGGQVQDAQITMVDGYAYIFSQGKWTVQKMEVDEAIQEAKSFETDEFAEKLFVHAATLEEVDGNYQIHYDFTQDLTGMFEGVDLKQAILDELENGQDKYSEALSQGPEELQSFITQIQYFLEMVDLEQLISDLLGAFGQMDLTYNKDTLKISAAEISSNFSAIELFKELIEPLEGLSGESITQGQDILVDYDLSIKINQYDGDFTIEKPADAPTYEEAQAAEGDSEQGFEDFDQESFESILEEEEEGLESNSQEEETDLEENVE